MLNREELAAQILVARMTGKQYAERASWSRLMAAAAVRDAENLIAALQEPLPECPHGILRSQMWESGCGECAPPKQPPPRRRWFGGTADGDADV